MKKIFALLLIALAAGMLFLNCSKPEVWEMSSWYTQMSRYKDSESKVFAIWTKTLEEEKIQKICDYYQDKFGDEDHYLELHFYDNRSFTPDYSKKVDYTEIQAEHIIARYMHNPYSDEKRLEFLR